MFGGYVPFITFVKQMKNINVKTTHMKRVIQSPVVLIPTWFIAIYIVGLLLSIIFTQS
jgi:hypothetical protein